MPLITFKAVLYLDPKPTVAEVLKRLDAAIAVVGEQLGVRLHAMDEVGAAILGGDERAFYDYGNQLLLVYEEADIEHSLGISLLDAYPQCAALSFQPVLREADRELTNEVWEWTTTVTKALIDPFDAALAQINGVDDEEGGQVSSPKTVRRGTLPDRLTPFTYLADPEGERLARAARAAGAYHVERLASGWAIQFVENFYCDPPPQLEEELVRTFGEDGPRYVQTEVFDP